MKAKVYQDPVTRNKFEGNVELIKQLKIDGEDSIDEYEVWVVRFEEDDLNLVRTIHQEDKYEN